MALNELISQQANVTKATESGRWLVAHSADDRTMSSCVRNLLSAGWTPLESLERKLSDRRHKLQSTIIYGLEAEVALQLIKERLLNLETNSSGRLISAILGTVIQQEIEVEAFAKQLEDLASTLQNVTSKLGSLEQGDEGSSVKSSVRKEANTLQSRLRALGSVLSQRKTLINEVKPLADEFNKMKIEVNNWLQETENDVSLINNIVLVDENSFKERLLRLKVS